MQYPILLIIKPPGDPSLKKLDGLNKSAKKCLARRGFDPRYGVRLLRREIQRSLEDPISEMLLKNVFTEGTTISVKALKNELIFNYKPGEKPKSKSPKLPSK